MYSRPRSMEQKNYRNPVTNRQIFLTQACLPAKAGHASLDLRQIWYHLQRILPKTSVGSPNAAHLTPKL